METLCFGPAFQLRDRTGRPIGIKERTNGAVHGEILGKHLQLSTARPLRMRNCWIFQLDNDPKHTVQEMQEWLRKKHLKVQEWNSQSLDLNPKENLWRELKVCAAYSDSQPKNHSFFNALHERRGQNTSYSVRKPGEDLQETFDLCHS